MTKQVTASSSCHLGGAAKVLDVQSKPSGSTSIRVVVTVDNWVEGYLVTIGVDGDGIVMSRAVHATQKPGGASGTFTFALGEEPVEMPAFAVVLEALQLPRPRLDGLPGRRTITTSTSCGGSYGLFHGPVLRR